MPIFVRPTSRALVGAFAQSRAYATVETPVIVAKPPLSPPPQLPTKESEPPSDIDRIVLDTLSRTPSGSRASLPQLIDQYLQRSGRVLDQHLPYESRPSPSRRADFASVTHHAQDPGAAKVHLIAHAAQEGDRHKVTLASGFAIKATGEQEGESLFITCAHTLEEVCVSPFLDRLLQVVYMSRHSKYTHCRLFCRYGGLPYSSFQARRVLPLHSPHPISRAPDPPDPSSSRPLPTAPEQH